MQSLRLLQILLGLIAKRGKTGRDRSSLWCPCVLGWVALFLFSTSGCLRTMEAIDPRAIHFKGELAQRLRAHVERLASPELAGRQPGTAGNRIAGEYIEARFREMGLERLPSLVGYRQPLSPELGDNIIGMKPAAIEGDSARWILIGAHFDHLGGSYLGADDNASAVAILIETARTLPSLSNHFIAVVAFNAEEPPYFGTAQMGSQHFVDNLPVEIGSSANLQAVIIMDLMGGAHWAPLQDAVFAAGAEKSPDLYRRVKEVGGPLSIRPVGMHLVEEVPGQGHEAFSDYDAFRNAGVPFLFLSAARTPRYHTPSDLPDTLHYERMAATVGWLQHLLTLMDQDRTPYHFEANRLEFADEVESFRTIIAQAADDRTLIPGTSWLSLRKLKEDAEWLRKVNVESPTSEDLKRLEQISFRFQCLLADYAGCFLL